MRATIERYILSAMEWFFHHQRKLVLWLYVKQLLSLMLRG